MSKKPISWPEFLKVKFAEMKKDDASLQFKNVLQSKEVKSEWQKITSGSHPDYIQGKQTRKGTSGKGKGTSKKSPRKSKGTRKNKGSAESSPAESSPAASVKKMDIQDLLGECKLCAKCKKEIQKVLDKKGMAGGCITCSL
jgi:hypothetical protein